MNYSLYGGPLTHHGRYTRVDTPLTVWKSGYGPTGENIRRLGDSWTHAKLKERQILHQIVCSGKGRDVTWPRRVWLLRTLCEIGDAEAAVPLMDHLLRPGPTGAPSVDDALGIAQLAREYDKLLPVESSEFITNCSKGALFPCEQCTDILPAETIAHHMQTVHLMRTPQPYEEYAPYLSPTERALPLREEETSILELYDPPPPPPSESLTHEAPPPEPQPSPVLQEVSPATDGVGSTFTESEKKALYAFLQTMPTTAAS